MDTDGKDALAVEVTPEQWTDSEIFASLLDQIDGTVAPVLRRAAASLVRTKAISADTSLRRCRAEFDVEVG